jgi:flagellin
MVLTITVDSVAKTHTIAVGATTLALALIDINTQWAADGVVATSDAAGHIVLTSTSKGANSTLAVSGAASTVLFGAGPPAGVAGVSRTLQSVVDALNAGFAGDAEMTKAGLQAAINGTAVQVLSQNSTYFRVNARGTAAGDVGFGITGATFTSSLTVASATNIVDDSNGASNSTALSYAALAYGNDDQAITVSANDLAGAIQSKTITLHNDAAAARQGRSIDEAINYINTQLQQSNNATLQKIVAVKEDVAGAEKINFLSSLTAFSVSVGSSPNSDGVSGGAASTVASAVLGTGSNMSVDTKAGALLAVSAVATAVTTLGSAQAAVGKGQNQLNYAIGLAQSQVSNFAAAESRIRDADVAAEAANLTKATVLQQTSLAAMAQANSAPQAVLALLRG